MVQPERENRSSEFVDRVALGQQTFELGKPADLTLHRKVEPERHTADVGGVLYDIIKLRSYAETLPTETVSLELLRGHVEPGHKYWIDEKGGFLGPAEILKNWNDAQANPLWKTHVAAIRNSNLDQPIWMTRSGIVFDGMHRLTKAFVEGVKDIKVKVFDVIPEFAVADNPADAQRSS